MKKMPSAGKIFYSVDSWIARITLNRPEKRNAIDAELIAELKTALAESAADSAVRVVLLTGAGSDFCSGADLSGLAKAREASVMENLDDARNMAEMFLAMRHHPRPIVAAVRGRALAGGCGIATACDLILAAESAQFGYPEVKIGFIPAMVMAILRRSVSEKVAFELITMGDVIRAAEAQSLGLVNRVFPDAEFDSGVEAFVAQLASRSASAVALSKNLLYQMDSMSFSQAIEAGVQANAIARMTEDCKAGIDRFLKK